MEDVHLYMYLEVLWSRVNFSLMISWVEKSQAPIS